MKSLNEIIQSCMKYYFKCKGKYIKKYKLLYGERYKFEELYSNNVLTYTGNGNFMLNYQYTDSETGVVLYGSRPKHFTDTQLGVFKITKY